MERHLHVPGFYSRRDFLGLLGLVDCVEEPALEVDAAGDVEAGEWEGGGDAEEGEEFGDVGGAEDGLEGGTAGVSEAEDGGVREWDGGWGGRRGTHDWVGAFAGWWGWL